MFHNVIVSAVVSLVVSPNQLPLLMQLTPIRTFACTKKETEFPNAPPAPEATHAAPNAGVEVHYTPASEFIGVDDVRYFVSDRTGSTGSANLRVFVKKNVVDNHDPIPNRFEVTVDRFSKNNIVLTESPAIGSDEDGDPLKLVALRWVPATHGDFRLEDGKVYYTPPATMVFDEYGKFLDFIQFYVADTTATGQFKGGIGYAGEIQVTVEKTTPSIADCGDYRSCSSGLQ